MKKLIYLLTGLLFMITNLGKAQIANFTVSPAAQCFNSNGTTGSAGISSHVPSATTYSWVITSPTSSCPATFSTASTATGAPSNSVININYSCCGIYTIACFAYNTLTFPPVLVTTILQTATVACSSSTLSVTGNTNICLGAPAVLHVSGANNYTWQPGNLYGDSIVVTPSVSTCYTVTGTSSTTCVSPKVVCVNVQSSGSVSINGPSGICAGSYATLYASGSTNYTWLPGGSNATSIVVSPTASTCYTLFGYTCSGLTSTVKCLTVSAAPVISVSGNTSVCSGQSTTISLSGASTYTWYPGNSTGSSIVISPTATTCYSVIGSNGNGCNGYAGICVYVNNSSTINVSGPSSICNGSSATLTASGLSTYTWQPGGLTGSSIVVSPSASICYTVSGSSGTGCSASAVKCLSVQSAGTLSIVGSNTVCQGTSGLLQAYGGTSYTWYPGGSTGSFIYVSPTVNTCYTLVGQTCSGTSTAVHCIVFAQNPTVTISGNTNVCPGNSTTLTASGASNYTWMNGSSTFTGSSIVITPTASSCYSVLGINSFSNGNYCGSYSTACVYVLSGAIGINGPSSVCSGNSATLTGAGVTSYTWYPGAVSGSSFVVTPSVSTCYTVIGTTNGGCTLSAVKCLSVQGTGSVSISGSYSTCAGTSNPLQASGGTSYTWYPGGSNSSYISPVLTANTCYTLVGQTCAGTSSVVHCVMVAPNPSLSFSGNTSLCPGMSTTLTASGATSYTWMNGSSTYTGSSIVITPTASTCYSVLGINSFSNGNYCGSYSGICVSIQSGTIGVSGPSAICAGNSATLNAYGAQNYTWYPGGFAGSVVVVSPSVSTCYTVTGSSGAGCSGSAVKCISISQYPTITTNNGSGQFCSGTAVLSASGASSYTWYPFNFTGSAITITVGSSMCYTVVGTNSAGCMGSAVNCFSVSPSPTITVSGSNVNCSGQSTTLTASGAQSYIWYPGGSSGSSIVISPSVSTCYTVAGTNNGCTSYAVKCVSVQTGPSITAAGGNTVCAGNTTTVFANGAITYTWLPGNITGAVIAITPSVSTCYTIVGTASNGCVGLGSLCMQVLPKPTITTSGGVYCAGSTTTLSASGANSYVWQPGNLSGSSIVITPSVTTCYTVTGSNSNGCSNQAVSCLSVIAAPVLNVSGANVICSGQSASLSVSGASNYTWLPGNTNGTNIVISPSVSTCYTVKGYNSTNGCISQAVKCVTVQASPVINVSGNNVLCSGSTANLLAAGANSYTWNTGSNSPFITVSPSLNTCYTVYGSNAQGCIGSAVKCVTVQSAPLISINGPSAICFGSNATFIASGASSYSWNTGSNSNVIVVSPITNTVYTVSGSNGVCSSIKSISVTVNPLPNIYVYTSDSTLCAGNSATLTAMGANSYTWNNGSVSSSIVVSPNVTSFYSVSGTGSNGCSNSVLMTVHVSACTGISEQTELSGVLLYPNPVKDQLHLQYSNSSLVTYKIYDLLGRELLKGEFNHEKEIDLSAFANGTYVIQLEAGSMSTYKKLVIEK